MHNTPKILNNTLGDTCCALRAVFLALLISTFIFTFSGNVFAQSSEDFTVKQQVGTTTTATTTPPTTPTSTTTPPSVTVPSGGGFAGLEIISLSVQPDLTKATINIETNIPAKIFLQWGKSANYEIGSVLTNDLSYQTSILIPDINPDTIYFFRLEAFDNATQRIALENQWFKTLSVSDLPLNVTKLKAVPDDEKITLTWKNPLIDFEAIRIIRSSNFFPQDPFDGELVYEGTGENFVDRNVLLDTDYFYSVFVRAKNGIYSSGAVVRSRLSLDGAAVDLFAGVLELPESDVDPLFKELTLKDFDFIQDGEPAQFRDPDTVVIQGNKALKVSLDYEKVPEVLKTIAISLKHPLDQAKVFSFLLRANKDRTAYEAAIAPLSEKGDFDLQVMLLDHKNRGLRKIAGLLKSLLPIPVVLPNKFFIWPFYFFLIVLGLFAIFLIAKERHPFSKRYQVHVR